MSDTFPKWTNHLPRNLIIGAVLVGTGVVLGATVRSRYGKATVCPYYNALRRQS